LLVAFWEDDVNLGRNLTKLQELMGSLHPSSILPNLSTVRHVLAPTDLSDESRKTIKYAMHLARRFQAKLTLLHVCQLPKASESGANSPDEKILEEERNRAKLSLLSLHDIIRAQHSNTEPCLRFGQPPEEVISTARSLAVDLIIVSQHDNAWLNRFLDKDDGKSILYNIACPVLIVREHEHEYAPLGEDRPLTPPPEVTSET
jgi:nucleotide-binding universal stress UspA family protein